MTKESSGKKSVKRCGVIQFFAHSSAFSNLVKIINPALGADKIE